MHSTGQLYSHKRKHERKDNENIYRNFKDTQSLLPPLGGEGGFDAFGGENGRFEGETGKFEGDSGRFEVENGKESMGAKEEDLLSSEEEENGQESKRSGNDALWTVIEGFRAVIFFPKAMNLGRCSRFVRSERNRQI